LARSNRTRHWSWAIAGVAAAGLVALTMRSIVSPEMKDTANLVYTQLTNIADAATQPALSPDGRLLAFIRGESTTGGPGQVYVKLLPDGEPVPLTNDTLL
jgi:hypothetical protein